MRGFPLILADAARAEQFLLLGRLRHLFDGFLQRADGAGNAWATKTIGGHAFAVTWLGSGWVFDAVAQERWIADLNARRHAMTDATPEKHHQELMAVVGNLHLGGASERMLWLIHQQVLRHRTSVLRLPDYLLADAIWGLDGHPAHWRQNILDVLTGLTWLHVADAFAEVPSGLGTDTALLTHVADLRGTDGDVCGETCDQRMVRRHHHFLVNVGRGFLGVLEEFAHEESGTGVRSYAFPLHGRSRKQSASLRRVGKSGQLVSVYLPAKLGNPSACRKFTANQHRLLQAIVRETTRNTRDERESVSEAEVFQGNVISTSNGKSSFACKLLRSDGAYIGFNGNKILKGRGYLIASEGGWMAKAGFSPVRASAFLDDLTVLSDKLGLIAIGIQNDNQCVSLKQIRSVAASPRAGNLLRHLHLRIYTASDYLARWNQFFGWADQPPVQDGPNDPALLVVTTMRDKKLTQAQLAEGMNVDKSLLNKVLRGKKPWPNGWLDRAVKWLNTQEGGQ